jgi:hypothetical protein
MKTVRKFSEEQAMIAEMRLTHVGLIDYPEQGIAKRNYGATYHDRGIGATEGV